MDPAEWLDSLQAQECLDLCFRASRPGSPMEPRFQIRRSDQGQFFYQLTGRGGRIFLLGEMAGELTRVRKTIAAIRTCAHVDTHYVRHTAVDGRVYFVLQAPDGTVLGYGLPRRSTVEVEVDIEVVRVMAPRAALRALNIQLH